MDSDTHPLDYLKRRRNYACTRQNMSERELAELNPSAPIVIEDDVWIGARCQILKGVTIGARSVIAAGSVVTKDIPSDVVAGGVPCRVIRNL
jgi:acetyltransferase-like isoleucine patch superfamily enzyme